MRIATALQAGLWRAPLVLRIGVGLALGMGLVVLGAYLFGPPLINTVDVRVFHQAGRVFLQGGDPYGSDFALWMTGDATRASYAYPPASFFVLLPMLPLPLPLAVSLWVIASIACLGLLAFLLQRPSAPILWLLPLIYYPSLYAITNTQWAPVLLGLCAASIYLYQRGAIWWAGFLVPFLLIKPTVGFGLALFTLIWSGRQWRWWVGAFVGGSVGYLLPLLMQPDWPLRWIASVQRYALPADRQNLVTLIDLWDGKLCVAIGGMLLLHALLTKRWRSVGCLLLILAMLITPHRAQYDYAVLCLPFLFLPFQWRWLALSGSMISWLFPLTFVGLGWVSSLQLTGFLFIPALLACLLIEKLGPLPMQT